MVSKQINSLSDNDLAYLEKILGTEYTKHTEYSNQFKNKHGYGPDSAKSKTILRLLNAVSAQRKLSNVIGKW